LEPASLQSNVAGEFSVSRRHSRLNTETALAELVSLLMSHE
jgi:hypothetical protein